MPAAKRKKKVTIRVPKASVRVKKPRALSLREEDEDLLLNFSPYLQPFIDARGPADTIIALCKSIISAARREKKRKQAFLTH